MESAVVAEPPWSRTLRPHRGLLEIPWRELWAYRDLIWLLARRDVSAAYKQTVLGPLWFVLQPILTTVVFSFLFGRLAKFGTDHLPHFLFYMAGLLPWNYLADCINKTSHTFTRNAAVFGKVYFPRMVMPLSVALTSLLAVAAQAVVLGLAMAFYIWKGAPVEPSWRVLILPVLLLQTGMLGLGLGAIVSALTTRFKDLALGVGFGVQLWMYASCVIFPLSRIGPEQRWVFLLNPMVPVVEGFRFALLGTGLVELPHLLGSFAACTAVFVLGVVVFNRAEQTVMDTV